MLCLTMESFDLLLGDECRGPGPDSLEAIIISAYQTTQEGGDRLPLGFVRGWGDLLSLIEPCCLRTVHH
jgi:hypothetical protein